MSYAELRRGQAGWNPLIQHRVVRCREVLMEIRILGDVRRRLKQFKAYGVAALAAEREY
jgi:hypothetical protein